MLSSHCAAHSIYIVSFAKLSSSSVLYILVDACGECFCTSWMYSASRTSGMHLQIWGGDLLHGSGGPVLVVCSFSRPARSQKSPGAGPNPGRATNQKSYLQAALDRRSMQRSMANFGMAFEPGWRSSSTSVPG
jgi:hypothetical protein